MSNTVFTPWSKDARGVSIFSEAPSHQGAGLVALGVGVISLNNSNRRSKVLTHTGKGINTTSRKVNHRQMCGIRRQPITQPTRHEGLRRWRANARPPKKPTSNAQQPRLKRLQALEGTEENLTWPSQGRTRNRKHPEAPRADLPPTAKPLKNTPSVPTGGPKPQNHSSTSFSNPSTP